MSPTTLAPTTASTSTKSSKNKKKRRPFVLAEGMGVTTALAPGSAPTAMGEMSATELAVPGEGGQHVVDKKFNGTGDKANQTMKYLGGPVINSAQIRLVFWGREWASTSPPVSVSQVVSDVQTICAGPYLDAVKQFGASSASVNRVVQITNSDPPNPVKGSDTAKLVLDLIDNGTFPEPDEDFGTALYLVVLPQRVNGASLSVPPGLLGAHSYATYSDFDFPFDFDNDAVYFAWISNNGRAGISTTISHEVVEAMTDPMGNGWQVTPTNASSWNEIGDVCRSSFVLNGVTVQSYWSAKDNSCVVPMLQPDVYKVAWIYKPSLIGHIEWMGGTRTSDGSSWQMPRNQIMNLVRSGDRFVVDGAISGRESTVGIYYRDAFHPYLATDMDGVLDDNLLALPAGLPH
jgi:Protein of unknown function (DUF3892)